MEKSNELAKELIEDYSIINPCSIINSVFFCLKCLMIPKYSIYIEGKSVILCHSCNGVQNEKIFELNIQKGELVQNKCSYCDNNKCASICTRCNKNVCSLCNKEHIFFENNNKKGLEKFQFFNREREINFCSIYEKQFICPEHFFKYNYFCPFCKVNLCNECIIGHIHINYHSLFKFEYKCNPTNYNIKDNHLSQKLILLSKYLDYCYLSGVESKYLTFNILDNCNLIEKISSFISQIIKKKNKYENKMIKSDLYMREKVDNYMTAEFGNYEFHQKYKKLIFLFQGGDIQSKYKMEKIYELYKSKIKAINYSDLWSFPYTLFSITDVVSLKKEIFLIKQLIHSVELKLLVNKFIKSINNMSLKLNIIETNLEIMKQLSLNAQVKLNKELRRKAGNLLVKSILSTFYEDIEPIEKNEYTLCYSVLELKDKLKKAKAFEGEKSIKEKYIKDLNEKLSLSLSLLKNNSNCQIEDINKGTFEINANYENKNLIQFKYSSENEKEIKKSVLLNLFFIIRNNMDSEFNYSIHHKYGNINSQIKTALENYKCYNEKIEDSKENEEREYNEINKNCIKENIVKSHEIIESIKIANNKNDIRNNKKCEKLFPKINQIKRIYKIETNIKEEYELLSSFPDKYNDKIINYSIDEFNGYLKKLIESYEVNSCLSPGQAIDLYLKDLISEILNKKKLLQNIKKINNEYESLKNSNVITPDILLYLDKINMSIKELLDSLEILKYKLSISIEKSSKYFDLEQIFKPEDENDFFDPFEIIDSIDQQTMSGDDSEKVYFVFQVNLYFCYEKYIEYLNNVLRKIKELKVEELLKNNEIKNKLIDQLKLEIPSFDKENEDLKVIWDSLKKSKISFVKNNISLNNKIKEYISKNNEADFLNDFKIFIEQYIEKINLEESDPQNLSINPFMRQNGLYLDTPKGLKIE